MAGPRSIKLNHSYSHKFLSFKLEEGVMWVLIKNPLTTSALRIAITDTQVRKLRDWLNWYLDRK